MQGFWSYKIKLHRPIQIGIKMPIKSKIEWIIMSILKSFNWLLAFINSENWRNYLTNFSKLDF